MKNINIDFKILGEHFVGDRNIKSVIEQMRKLKRKHEATGKGLWTVYVKAYNFDIGEALEGDSKSCENCKHFIRVRGLSYECNKYVTDLDYREVSKFSCSKHEPEIIKALEK